MQANFGGVLTIDGLKVGEALEQYDFRNELTQAKSTMRVDPEEGYIMVVIATDAPAGSRKLERMARRAPIGIVRTGGYISNGSGDFVIAFSIAERLKHAGPEAVREHARLTNHQTSALFLAVIEAVEEAIYNVLLAAETMTGVDGHTLEALPLERLRRLAQP